MTEVEYLGEKVVFPKPIDNVLGKVDELNLPHVVKIYDHVPDPIGQFTHLVNDHILPNYERPDVVFLIEPDHVVLERSGKTLTLKLKDRPQIAPRKPAAIRKRKNRATSPSVQPRRPAINR